MHQRERIGINLCGVEASAGRGLPVMAGDWLAGLELRHELFGHPGLHPGMTGRKAAALAGYWNGRLNLLRTLR